MPHSPFAKSIHMCSHCGCICVFTVGGYTSWCVVRKHQEKRKTYFFGSSQTECSQDHLLHFKTSMWIIEAVCRNEGDFQKYTQGGGGKAPKGKRWCRGGESKPNLTLLLIYLILTAQRFKRNMEWKPLRSVFLQPSSLIYSSFSLPLYIFQARIDSKKIQQLIDLCTVQHSTEQALAF